MSNQMAQLQEATIKAQCKSLRMPMMASQFGTLAEQAIREKKSHIGYLEALLLAEIEERERNTIERRIREAHLPRVHSCLQPHYKRCTVLGDRRNLHRPPGWIAGAIHRLGAKTKYQLQLSREELFG